MILLRIAFFAWLFFIKLNLFYLSKIRKMPANRKRVFYVRNLFRKFGLGIIKRTKAKVNIIYEDKNEFDKIKLEEPMVIISNHQSNMDIPLIISCFPFIPGFMAKKEMETWFFFKTWMPLANSIFINRQNPREAIKKLRYTTNLVKDGYPILIFPEGTRSSDGAIGEFKNGGLKVAIDAKAKIIPITIKGTYNIQNKHSTKINTNQDVTFIIGKTIDTTAYDRDNLKNMHNIVRDKIVANYEKF